MPRYSHSDKKAFWLKDVLATKQVCLSTVSRLYSGEEPTKESIIKKAEELLEWFYPNGTQYKCEDTSCKECYGEDAVPF